MKDQDLRHLIDEHHKISRALYAISSALHQLGNADAATPMGAIEAHGLATKEAASEIASALRDVADAIREER